ncbi:MAG: hypothetical protein HY720_27740 [Planctomycetes bacterium]|nr:hypothetical protein [Planctomycetota bacterium]
MRFAPIVFALGTVAFLSGCGRSESDLHGTWTVDVDKMLADQKETKEYKDTPEDQRVAGEKMLREMMSKSEFTFSEGKLISKTGDKTEEISWKVVSMDGDKWTIETKEKDKDAETGTLEWIDNDHVKLTNKDDKDKFTFWLVRKK